MKKFAEKFMIFLCVFTFIITFSSCKQTSQSQSASKISDESVGKSEDLIVSKTLQVYSNGVHTFSLWEYNKENETMILIFDENKVIHSHYVFEEFNTDESITYFNGSDKDYNWRIQVKYDNIDDKYEFFFGDDENKLLYDNDDFSGEYSFFKEKNVSLEKALLESPLDFEVIKRTENIISNNFKSRANGIWHCTISKIDMQTLKIHDNGLFELYYLSAGEIKEVIEGTYIIVSDDGKYQEFKFINADDIDDTWVAKIFQTDLKDDYGAVYNGIVYINSNNETVYYTGTKW